MTSILVAAAVLSATLIVQDKNVGVVTSTPIERALASGEQHTYQLPLQAGDAATIVVEHRGISITVRVLDPQGGLLVQVQTDLRRDGEERPTIAAGATGAYSVVVQSPFRGQGDGGYAIRLGEIRPATVADRSLQQAATLRAEGVNLYDAGKLEESAERLRRALEIVEKVRGPEDPATGRIAWALAVCVLDQRRFAEAESLFQRALMIFERTLGANDPVTLSTLQGLGVLYFFTGQRVKSQRALQTSLTGLEETLGPQHPSVARSLVGLAMLRHEAGDLEQAEAFNRRALTIAEASVGTDTRLYADLANNLGILYLDKGDYTLAEDWLRRALPLGERLRGPDSGWVATTLNNLGIIARRRGQYDEAERDYVRALSIHERILGSEHPDVATDLNNLAIVYANKGDTARSIETHLRALRIREQSTGEYSAATLASLGNIARTYARIGDIPNAFAYQQRTDSVVEKQLALNAAIGSERQKLALVASTSERTDRTISLNLDRAPQSTDASALAAVVILQRKGRGLDAMTDMLASVQSRSASPEDQKLLTELKATTTEIAARVLNRPVGLSQEEQQKVKNLEARKEQIEATISDHNLEFRVLSQTVTLESVQAAIPSGAVLVEYAVYRPFDPTAANNDVAYGLPHYAVYVIGRSGEPRGRDLGPTGPIDAAIGALRDALPDPHRADVSRLARELDARVFEPIRAELGNATRLLISPDGALNLIPFESLVDRSGKFAVERYAISYLSSGRDLLRMQIPRGESANPVIVANPLFGEPDAAGSPMPQRASTTAKRSVTSSTDLSHLYFAPLAGTGEEARAIHALVPDATLLTRENATKPAMTQVTAPRILHIATHGFFLQGAASGPSPAPAVNPLLRSGLALAGANRDRGASVLTALEASHLNLWGTKLVTLSACDTGIGEVRNGEGVYGLRRSFFLAGAETLVMSLWPVSDYVTRQMMTTYYRGLAKGLGRGEALRRAQLSILAQPNHRAPFYWASFIQAGDWRPLNP